MQSQSYISSSVSKFPQGVDFLSILLKTRNISEDSSLIASETTKIQTEILSDLVVDKLWAYYRIGDFEEGGNPKIYQTANNEIAESIAPTAKQNSTLSNLHTEERLHNSSLVACIQDILFFMQIQEGIFTLTTNVISMLDYTLILLLYNCSSIQLFRYSIVEVR